MDPMSAMGGGASPYMKDLAEKLAFIKGEVFALYGVPELVRDWCAPPPLMCTPPG